MLPAVQAVIALAFVGLVVALIVTCVAVRRAAQRAENVLGILETELRPLVADTHALLADVRSLTRQANREMERVGVVTEHVEVVAEGLGRVVGALSGFARVGQVLGVALGLKKGVDVFLHRLAKGQGDHHHG
ncbi:MAG: DUF948 domain-containing protein [Candidatus Rokubacteria bacterium]|nr:DUF948 domain-containing protein [Candidatus Rokubacteria bacterium]